MKTYTVKELYDELGKAIKKGKGHLIVLVPNVDDDNGADYATLRDFSFYDDNVAEYAYLDANSGEEEENFWRDKE